MAEMDIRLDYHYMSPEAVGAAAGISRESLAALEEPLRNVQQLIQERQSANSDPLGFLDLPYQPVTEISRLEKIADSLAALGDRHIVLGIGGSYLGAKAVIDALTDPFRNERSRRERQGRPRIAFEGNNLDPAAMQALLSLLPTEQPDDLDRDFTLNVISKSGTTLETALAFRILRQRMLQVYGPTYAKRIVATTDAKRGLLYQQAVSENFEHLVIPDDVGGRFSVLTPVGLLPAAVAGVDISGLLAGARRLAERMRQLAPLQNPAYLYAALQYLSARGGRNISVMVSWGKALEGVAMWYDQLCAESLGKEGGGRIPISAVNTRDLHARGQQLQQGPRNAVITNLAIDRHPDDLAVPCDEGNSDQLNYVAGKTLGQILQRAREATLYAYARDGRPSLTIHLPELNAFTLGQLFYLLEVATLVEGHLCRINPLDQPGVEDYKSFMFGLLGRPDKAHYLKEFAERPAADPAFVI
ncbi:MAG: glucose-6-phosphate isomerase [Cyanobacteria bacterium NC_groundwater_1444_Ag_S-0.65um_54_12]|nr:glucose-6-phosphate isomerase [Cyanobacteria bacterium NC_groundwater_1444_Ag_S-0.65um_54_12]